jgi:hypothetical protein
MGGGGLFFRSKMMHCFFVSPVALRHRNKDPAPLRHPVDVFFRLFVLLSGNILPDVLVPPIKVSFSLLEIILRRQN